MDKRLSLCSNDTCRIRKICMRFRLKGNLKKDIWVMFNPSYHKKRALCTTFIHINSEKAKEYIQKEYTIKNITGGQYEQG